VLIAQLSDTHVCRPGHLYKEVSDSNRKLCEAIEHLHRLDRRPDLVLLSGDLVDEGHPDEYAMARELLGELQFPISWLPATPTKGGRRQIPRAEAQAGVSFMIVYILIPTIEWYIF
jgi:hypothetical protein